MIAVNSRTTSVDFLMAYSLTCYGNVNPVLGVKDSTRAKIASVVGAAVSGQAVLSVYDFDENAYYQLRTEVRNGSVKGYDVMSGCQFGGQGLGTLGFYDEEVRAPVQLQVKGNSFSGYDYYTHSHFSGAVSGSCVSVYDHQTGRYHSFHV